MSVTLLVRIRGKDGHGDALSAMLQPMPRENDLDGCMGWDVFRNSSDGDDFLLVERWESVAAHKAHIAAVEKAGGFEEVESHARSIERTYLQETS